MLSTLPIMLVFSLGLALTGWLLYFRLKRQHARQQHDLHTAIAELEDHKQKLYKVELENRDIQLNPHLFKNTLHAVQSYAYKTHLALDKLGGVLDYILYDSKVSFISLEEELDFILNFIELNKFRLNPLFEFNTNIQINRQDALFTRKLIMPMLTVDFIENAFRHGDLHSHEAFIAVSIQLQDGRLSYTVSNRINPNPVATAVKGGLGQKNFRDRLAMMYNKDFELSYHQQQQMYKSALTLNLHDIDHKMRIAGR